MIDTSFGKKKTTSSGKKVWFLICQRKTFEKRGVAKRKCSTDAKFPFGLSKRLYNKYTECVVEIETERLNMSWDFREDIFDNFEDAKKAFPMVSDRRVYSEPIGNLEDARRFASVRDAVVVAPFVSSSVDSSSENAQKLLAAIQKVQEDSRKKILPLFKQFNVAKLKCKHCESVSNMSFSRQNYFPFELYLTPNESAMTKYNIETDGCVDEWRVIDEDKVLCLFRCPVCKRVENVMGDKVRKIVESANNKLLVLQKKLFAEIAGKTKVRYLACLTERI